MTLCGRSRNLVQGFGRLPQTTPELFWKNPKLFKLLGTAAFLELVHHVSAMCPPCVRLVSPLAAPNLVVWLGRASKPCPPCVRFVSAFGPAPPPGRAPTPCPPCVCPPWVHFGRASASKPCPPCPRHTFDLASPPNLGRHVSGVRLALYPPCVGFGHASKRCLSHVALCVRHVSAPCLFFVLSLSARCSLFIRSWSVFGRVCGLALAGPLSALCPLFGFCAFVCSASVVVGLGRGLCGYALACCSSVWSPLAGSALVCLKASPRICTLSSVFPLRPFFCLCVGCLGFVCVCLRLDLY